MKRGFLLFVMMFYLVHNIFAQQSSIRFYDVILQAKEIFGNKYFSFSPMKADPPFVELRAALPMVSLSEVIGCTYTISNKGKPVEFLGMNSSMSTVSIIDSANYKYYTLKGYELLDKVYNRRTDTMYEKFRTMLISSQNNFIQLKSELDKIEYEEYFNRLKELRFVKYGDKDVEYKKEVYSRLEVKLVSQLAASIENFDLNIDVRASIKKVVSNGVAFDAKITYYEFSKSFIPYLSQLLKDRWAIIRNRSGAAAVQTYNEVDRRVDDFLEAKDQAIISYATIMEASFSSKEGRDVITDIVTEIKGQIPQNKFNEIVAKLQKSLTIAFYKSKSEEYQVAANKSYYVLGIGIDKNLEVGNSIYEP